jgi:ABC-type taurine transport system substrate-binding protein
MHYVRSDDEEVQCIALGHDLVEDTFPNVAEGVAFLRYHGFSERVIAGIVALTKVPGESFEAYKERVKANPDAVQVKMADLRHNSDIRRLKGVREKDIARVVKYHQFYLELKTTICPDEAAQTLDLEPITQAA